MVSSHSGRYAAVLVVCSSPSGASAEKLQQRRAALLAQSELHSKQLEQAQAKLMEARQAEEARGGVPGGEGCLALSCVFV